MKQPPRKRRHTRQFDYEGDDQNQDSSTEDIFKRDFFYALVDTACISIEERFHQLQAHSDTWGFLYHLHDLQKLPKKELTAHCMDLHHHLSDGDHCDINGADLCMELGHLPSILPPGKGSPRDALQYLLDIRMSDAFPNVWVALRILLTLPVSVASGERSFSKLKLIKTYLRSTMEDERLSSLAMISIENDIAQKLDLSGSIQEFAQAKARKAPF